jgi:hypothetical protein
MTLRLKQLRARLVKARANGQRDDWAAHAFQQGLLGKVQRLLPSQIAGRIRGNGVLTVPPRAFAEQFLDDVLVDHLLRPTSELRFLVAQLVGLTSREIVFSAQNGRSVECFRDASTLLINREDLGKTQSWSRLMSISRAHGASAYPKHLHAPKYRGAEAKYHAGVDPARAEARAVMQGFGHLDTENRILFYGRFADQIGVTGRQGARMETDLLCVQLDRVPRPSVRRRLQNGTASHLQGWEVQMHGYPVSDGELRRHFPSGAEGVRALALPAR